LDPDFFVPHYQLAWLYSQLGQYQNAITELTKGRLLSRDDRVKIAVSEEVVLRKAIAAGGARGFWQQIQVEEKIDPEVGEFAVAQVYARLGDKEKALERLDRNYEEREALGTLLNVDPAFDSLRSDPRFGDLARRMGLIPNTKEQ
jgi:tetratricopeptide (TPR) repeat protein